jgi:hypothetical protein
VPVNPSVPFCFQEELMEPLDVAGLLFVVFLLPTFWLQ